MTDTNELLFDYLHSRNRPLFDRTVKEYRSAGLSVPAVFGSNGHMESKPAENVNQASAQGRFLIGILEAAEKDYDLVVSKVRGKLKWRANFKIASALISTISSSALLVLLGSNDPSSGPVRYFAAALALVASLASVLQDNIGTRTSSFWESLLAASQGKVSAQNTKLQIESALTLGMDSQEVDSLQTSVMNTVQELRRLLSGIEIEELKSIAS